MSYKHPSADTRHIHDETCRELVAADETGSTCWHHSNNRPQRWISTTNPAIALKVLDLFTGPGRFVAYSTSLGTPIADGYTYNVRITESEARSFVYKLAHLEGANKFHFSFHIPYTVEDYEPWVYIRGQEAL